MRADKDAIPATVASKFGRALTKRFYGTYLGFRGSCACGDGEAAASAATVPAAARARATITQKEPGVISGLEPALLAFRMLDASVTARIRSPPR